MTRRVLSPFARLTDRLRRRLRMERGSVLVLTSFITVVVIGTTAIAVDIGHGISHKRDLQAATDLAALDAVRALGDRKVEQGSMTPQEFAEKLAKESLLRNDFDVTADDHTWLIRLGEIDPVTWTFQTTDQYVATAVEVSIGSPIDFAFQPGGQTYNARSAAQVGSPIGGISVGSWLARLDTSKSALANKILTKFLGAGSELSLDLVSYQGLADASVTLSRLKTALNLTAGTPEEFLDTTVTVKDLLSAMATALTAQGDPNSLAAVTPITTLAAAASNTLTLKMSDLISVASGAGSSALDASINVFTLASMAAQVADTDHFVTLNSGIAIPGVASSTIDLQLIEAPQIAIGPAEQVNGEWVATVKTAQIRARINLSLQATATLSVLLLGLVQIPVQVPIYIDGASAEASIRSITCNDTLDTSTMGVHVESEAVQAQIGNVTLAALQDVNATVEPTPGTITSVSILGLGLLNVTGSQTFSTPTTSTDMTFNGPWNMDNTQSNNGSTTLGLANGLTMGSGNLAVNLLSINVAALKTSILNVINPVLSILDDGLIDDLVSMLGLSLGGADVTAWHLECGRPSLAG